MSGVGGGVEVREELLNRLHELTDELISLEGKAMKVGWVDVADQLEVARSFMVAAVRRANMPQGHPRP